MTEMREKRHRAHEKNPCCPCCCPHCFLLRGSCLGMTHLSGLTHAAQTIPSCQVSLALNTVQNMDAGFMHVPFQGSCPLACVFPKFLRLPRSPNKPQRGKHRWVPHQGHSTHEDEEQGRHPCSRSTAWLWQKRGGPPCAPPGRMGAPQYVSPEGWGKKKPRFAGHLSCLAGILLPCCL